MPTTAEAPSPQTSPPDPTPSGNAPATDAPPGSLLHAEALTRPHFDAELYAEEYRDLSGDPAALLRHFCERGWKEGRNPNAGFDTASYLLMHRDVAEHGVNPFVHYLMNGRGEGRVTIPAFMPRAAAQRVLGTDPGDWVTLLRPLVDEAFYAASVQADGSFDPVAHFAYRGWLEDRDPNPDFNTRAALAARPDLREERLNPLLHALMQPDTTVKPTTKPAPQHAPQPGRVTSTRFPDQDWQSAAALLVSAQPPPAPTPAYQDQVEQVVAKHLDATFYLAMYADVQQHGADPVTHYCQSGWTEGRDPADWFDTAYYLGANPDVAGHGMNPFWHYLVAGQAEGRAPRRPGGRRRTIIDNAVDPDEITNRYTLPAPTEPLSRAQLDKLLRPVIEASKGLALSIGHDRYTNVTGGIQLFIADEQRQFAERHVAYLNISPVIALLRLADPNDAGLMMNLVLDGAPIGTATYADLAGALRRLPPRAGDQRLFLVHCLFGHGMMGLAALQRASASSRNLFWLHDYSSLCVGYNLLRNDVAFCGAPPPGSMTCRICIYGERRALHLEQVRTLFEAASFHVVAPSRAALAIWRAHTALPYASAATHEHCDLISTGPATPRDPAPPIRVAFIGYPRPQKGWPLWQEIVSRSTRLGVYRFLHLGTAATIRPSPNVDHHLVATSPAAPDAMLDAVARLEIDLVLILSPWPETFSYVTYESLAGGADIACLADSGNVADTVLRRGRGVVAADEASLLHFFESGEAAAYAMAARVQGTPPGQLLRVGTTATLDMVANA
jgi:glycosyltransferase involved in cell wall biosynthesis